MTADRRRPSTQRPLVGGRRLTDAILDLETEHRPFVTLTMLATYFMVDRRFLVECVKASLLRVHALKGSEWRVKTVNALAFEQSQLHQTAPVRGRRPQGASVRPCTRQTAPRP